MKRYFTYRYALLLGIFLLCGGLSACSLKSNYKNSSEQPLHIPSVIIAGEDIAETAATTPGNSTGKAIGSAATSVMDEVTLSVRGALISLGDSKKNLVKKLGIPSRVVDTEYDFDYYVYNNDYKRLVFIAIKNSKVVGFYTDSKDFNFKGFSYGASISNVNHALNENFTLAEVLTQKNDSYTLKVLMDTLDSKTVVGVYLLANNVKMDGYTDSVIKNIELLSYDLTNSVRARYDLSALTWSSTVANASRKHSNNMAEHGFFDHMNPEGQTPSDRMTEAGILYNTIGENIIGGYGTAVLSTHAWFNSSDHRKNMLNKKFRYLGIGFAFQKDSLYKTYITQNYYR